MEQGAYNAELAATIDRASADAGPLDGVVEQFRAMEVWFVNLAGANASLITETKRRIAEAVFMAAVIKTNSFEPCSGYFADLQRLGFSDRRRELTYSTIFARHCLHCGRPAEGISMLQQALGQGMTARERRDEPCPSVHDIRIGKDLLRDLEAALYSSG